jgi:hypothetical protein
VKKTYKDIQEACDNFELTAAQRASDVTELFFNFVVKLIERGEIPAEALAYNPPNETGRYSDIRPMISEIVKMDAQGNWLLGFTLLLKNRAERDSQLLFNVSVRRDESKVSMSLVNSGASITFNPHSESEAEAKVNEFTDAVLEKLTWHFENKSNKCAEGNAVVRLLPVEKLSES